MALCSKSTFLKRHASGYSLIELSISMMIMSLLGVGLSSLFKTQIEHTIAERHYETMQLIIKGIEFDLRHDLLTADRVNSIGAGSNTLIITTHDPDDYASKTITYTYHSATDSLSRKDSAYSSVSKKYNDLNKDYAVVITPGQNTYFFHAGTNSGANSTNTGTVKELKIIDLTVSIDSTDQDSQTPIEKNFSGPPSTSNTLSFSVPSGIEFN